MLTLSDMEMSFSYCLLDTPVPLFNYVAHVRLTPVTDTDSTFWEWESRFDTYLGMAISGFPNLFIVAGPQGTGGSFNFLDAIEDHSEYLVWLLSTMRDQGHGVVEIGHGFVQQTQLKLGFRKDGIGIDSIRFLAQHCRKVIGRIDRPAQGHQGDTPVVERSGVGC